MLNETLFSRLRDAYPAVRALDPASQLLLREQGVPVELPPGQVLFEEGNACAGFLFLVEGMARIYKESARGRIILLYSLLPGESCVLSLGCLLGRATYPARGVVQETVTGVTLPRGVFEQLVVEAPPWREMVFVAISNRLVHLTGLVEDVAFRRLDERLAAHLLRKAAETGCPELTLTHQDLADELGSVREIVSRLLESFEARGAVRLSRGRLVLEEPEILEQIRRDS